MELQEAMLNRHSVRKYKPIPLPDDVIGILNDAIEKTNLESGLDIRLIIGDSKSFSTIGTKMTGFTNVQAYLAIIGDKSPDLNEKAGYYGEQLVILAQSIGLNSCWSEFCSKKFVSAQLKDNQKMIIGIALGYGEDSGVPHKNKPIEDIADMDDTPEWFKKGVECVLLAPSGLNKQPFHFSIKDGRVLATCKGKGMAEIDLGIAKYHFEFGAGKENFDGAHRNCINSLN